MHNRPEVLQHRTLSSFVRFTSAAVLNSSAVCSAVAATPDMKTLIAAGSDKKIKEMEDNMVSRASSMADCHDMMFIHDQACALLLLSKHSTTATKHSITARARATHLIR